MSLSDCERCWNTPCCCGGYDKDALVKEILKIADLSRWHYHGTGYADLQELARQLRKSYKLE